MNYIGNLTGPVNADISYDGKISINSDNVTVYKLISVLRNLPSSAKVTSVSMKDSKIEIEYSITEPCDTSNTTTTTYRGSDLHEILCEAAESM